MSKLMLKIRIFLFFKRSIIYRQTLFENTHNIQNAKSDWSRYVIHRAITGHSKWIFYHVVLYISLRKLHCM